MAGKAQQQQAGGRGASHDQLLREWVYLALTSKANGGDATQYSRLVKEFSSMRRRAEKEGPAGGDVVPLLTNFIVVLKDFVSLFRERHHEAILGEVLGIKIWTAAPSVRAALLDLVSTLVVVNASFTQTCLRLLVGSLVPPPAPPAPDGQPGADAGAAWQPEQAQLEVQGAITGTLIKVLGLVPTAPVSLMQLVGSHMPHKLRDRNSQCLYFQALFALAEAPVGRPIRDALLAAVVEHLLSLDVEIRWEDIVDTVNEQAAEEQGEDVGVDVEDIFELEGMHELDLNATPEQLERLRQERQAAGRGGWEGGAKHAAAAAGAEGQPQQPASVQAQVDETADKLDSLMELTFAHLERRCLAPGGGGPTQAWSALVACFERTILNAHRSKFSQYLVFFLCHKHPEPCVRLFAEFLLGRLQDARLPPITRAGCAAYLASFLARCAHAPHLLVLQAVEALVRFAEHWAACVFPPSAPPSPHGLAELQAELASPTGKHQVFYATVQAVLYVLCYHMHAMLSHQHTHHHKQAVPAALRQLLQARVLPLLAGPMQPVRVLLPSVVAEFRAQLLAHGFGDAVPGGLAAVFAAARAPADGSATEAGTAASAAAAPQRPLEMFFPFDPYLLRRSSRMLDLPRSYVYWRRGAAARGRAAQDEGSVSDGDGDEEGGEPSASSKPQGTAPDEDEDGDLELHSDDDSSSSSSTSTSSDDDDDDSDGGEEDASLRGGSLGTSMGGAGSGSGVMPMGSVRMQSGAQSMVRLPRARAAGAPPLPGTAAAARAPASSQQQQQSAQRLRQAAAGAGGKSRPSPGSGTLVGGSSFDAMATSFTGGGLAMSSMGDGTPLGTSPVVVEYGAVGGQSFSPMQMTPVQLGGHMEAMMAARGRVAGVVQGRR